MHPPANASNDPREHIVQPGENPWSITKLLFPDAPEELTPFLTQQLMARNGIQWPEQLSAGQVLSAPDGTESVENSKLDFLADVERLRERSLMQSLEGSRYSGLNEADLNAALAGVGQRQEEVNRAAEQRALAGARFTPGFRPQGAPNIGEALEDMRTISDPFRPHDPPREWNAFRAAGYLAGNDIFPFKDQWVRGYRDAIRAAASQYNLPPELVAGVAHIEVGGDPHFVDGAAHRVSRWGIRDKPPEQTSFGDVSIQLRRAGQTLGVGDSLGSHETDLLTQALRDPLQNIFISARHLADLRDLDFPGVAAENLSADQVRTIATRYNVGPGLDYDGIQGNLDYGDDLVKRWDLLNYLLFEDLSEESGSY